MADTHILVMSDTHGNYKAVQQLLDTYLKHVSAVIHLGDITQDLISHNKTGLENFHIVNGNVDFMGNPDYEERVIELSGKKIFITHGHRYSVKSGLDNLVYKAQELGVNACLFGHTHQQIMFKQDGILFLNPGSPTYPRVGSEKGYALLRISEEGAISAKLLAYRTQI